MTTVALPKPTASELELLLLLFALGAYIAYWTFPRALEFLTNFNDDVFQVQIRASYYFSFVTLTLLATGVAFVRKSSLANVRLFRRAISGPTTGSMISTKLMSGCASSSPTRPISSSRAPASRSWNAKPRDAPSPDACCCLSSGPSVEPARFHAAPGRVAGAGAVQRDAQTVRDDGFAVVADRKVERGPLPLSEAAADAVKLEGE